MKAEQPQISPLGERVLAMFGWMADPSQTDLIPRFMGCTSDEIEAATNELLVAGLLGPNEKALSS